MANELAEFFIVLLLLGIAGTVIFIFFDPSTRGAIVTYIVGIHDMFINSTLGT